MIKTPRTILAWTALATVLLAAPASAAADAYLRVISQKAAVHSGPGNDYREIYYAERGDVFEVREREHHAGSGSSIQLEDGTSGWVFGELVFPFEVVDRATPPASWSRIGACYSPGALLGPTPVVRTDVEISFSAGILDQEGLFLLRPAWLVDKHFAIEGFGGLSPRQQKDVFLGGLGLTLRLAPGAIIGPYVHAGVGVSYIRPKADNFTDDEETLMSMVAGGGFEITFKKQITLRLDFRNWTLFDPDQSSNAQEYTSGLAIFF